MLQRWAFAIARHGRKWNYIVSTSSPIPPPNPIPKLLVSFSSSSRRVRCIFPQFSYLSNNNPRFFSQITTHPDVTVPSEGNGVVPMDYYDAGEFENVASLLLRSKSNADDDVDGSLESSLNSLQHLTTTLNQHFVLKLIETPNVSGHNLIRFIKWAWNKKSFKVTTSILESLVSAICGGADISEKEIYSLWDLVNDIGHNESGVLTVRVLHQLILSFSDLGEGKAALEVFKNFEMFQCVPNKDTYYFTIKALCRESKEIDHGWSVCQKMLDSDSLPDDAVKMSHIVSWFCLSNMAKQAHAVFLAAKEKRKQQLPSCCFNLMAIKLCDENETVQLALEMLLNDIPEEGREQVIQPFTEVIRALCRIKQVDAAKQLILKMIADGPPPGIAAFKYVIAGYTIAGEMGQAMEMVKLLESRGFKPDLDLMSGNSNGVKEARKIMEEAKRKRHLSTAIPLEGDFF